jgi:hypothetical protein
LVVPGNEGAVVVDVVVDGVGVGGQGCCL